MDVFVTRECVRLLKRAKISDDVLLNAIEDANRGLVDADIGSGVIKQRLPGPSSGKARGSRAILFFVRAERAVFLHVFSKNAKANLTPTETEAYRDFASVLRTMEKATLEALVETRGWRRIGP